MAAVAGARSGIRYVGFPDMMHLRSRGTVGSATACGRRGEGSGNRAVARLTRSVIRRIQRFLGPGPPEVSFRLGDDLENEACKATASGCEPLGAGADFVQSARNLAERRDMAPRAPEFRALSPRKDEQGHSRTTKDNRVAASPRGACAVSWAGAAATAAAPAVPLSVRASFQPCAAYFSVD